MEQLRDAQVSEKRLREVAKWSSRSGFSKDSGKVPVSLFRKVLHSSEEYIEYGMTINDRNKGEFVKPPMAQRANNEDEWFDRHRQQICGQISHGKNLKLLEP